MESRANQQTTNQIAGQQMLATLRLIFQELLSFLSCQRLWNLDGMFGR